MTCFYTDCTNDAGDNGLFCDVHYDFLPGAWRAKLAAAAPNLSPESPPPLADRMVAAITNRMAG